jgi:hypothetical protein
MFDFATLVEIGPTTLGTHVASLAATIVVPIAGWLAGRNLRVRSLLPAWQLR